VDEPGNILTKTEEAGSFVHWRSARWNEHV
jgi:hypothetical protein